MSFRSNTSPAERPRAPEERNRLPQLPPTQYKQEKTSLAVFPHADRNQTLTEQSRRPQPAEEGRGDVAPRFHHPAAF